MVEIPSITNLRADVLAVDANVVLPYVFTEPENELLLPVKLRVFT